MRSKAFFAVILLLAAIFSALGVSAEAEDAAVYMLELEDGSDPLAVFEKIKSEYPNTELLYIYKNIFNGIAVRVSENISGSLYSFDNIKTAEISRQWQDDSDDISPSEITEAFSGYRDESIKYRGEGTVAAVIDSSFDIENELFTISEETVPALTKQDIDAALKKGLAASNHINTFPEKTVYISKKIPYAFNYAYYGASLAGSSSHGTHVAGILAGNAGETEHGFDGIAPEAQLLLMATSDPATGRSDNYVVLAAIDDAIALGADVISMSLGSYSGFSEALGQETLIYKAVSKAVSEGIPVVCAAGNEYRVGEGSVYDSESGLSAPLASNPDSGTVNSPASFPEVIAVASAYSGYSVFTGTVTASDGSLLSYTTGSEGLDFLGEFDDGIYQIAQVNGLGTTIDYSTADVRGKIAVVKRGVLTFSEKINAAQQHGAIGVIIYDNEYSDVLISMDTAGTKIPAIFISLADGEKLLSQAEKYIKIKHYDEFTSIKTGGVRLSPFSSSGVTPELLLKPEITAFGENIVSGVRESSYVSMSGTSMATPNISGSILLLKQKYRTEADRELSVSEIKNIIMNTALPIFEEGAEYSPRRQGAGLIDISAALSSNAVLLSEQMSAKAELGEIKGESFGFTVTVENLSSSSQKFAVSASVLSDGFIYDNASGKYFISDGAAAFENAAVYPDGNKTNINRHAKTGGNYSVEIGVGEKISVSFEIKLDEDALKLYKKVFNNGFFIDGFVYFTSDDSELSIPYMGFCGDWDSLEVLDSPDEPFFGFSLTSGKWNGELLEQLYLGYNHYSTAENKGRADQRFYIISPNGDGLLDSLGVELALLRNADDINFRITDKDGNNIYEKNAGSQRKSLYFKEYESVSLLNEPSVWDGTESDNYRYTLPDGSYIFTVEAKTAAGGETQTRSFPLTVDTEKPRLLSAKLDNNKLKVTVRDENYIQSICLYSTETSEDSEQIRLQKIFEGGGIASEYTETFSLEKFKSNVLYLEIIDFGFNKTVVRLELEKL